MNTKKVFLTAIALMGLCASTAFAQETGVVIDGVTWATRNVNEPNTFAATPADAGMFYQWNRTAAFSITDPMTSIGGSWADVASGAEEWEIANNVCPSGWRVPTKEEFESLIASGGEWVTEPANGFSFGSGDNTVFFPAAGERFYDGTLVEGSTDGLWGGYWSSELKSASQPWLFAFDESEGWISYFNGREGYSVRCVKDEGGTVATATVSAEDTQITGYYNITGQRLAQEPASGVYIIMYDNGKTEKVLK